MIRVHKIDAELNLSFSFEISAVDGKLVRRDSEAQGPAVEYQIAPNGELT